jgi:hypothetical protein
MKKSLLLIAVIFSQIIAFSQIKHITFIDSLRVPNAFGSMLFRSVAEIPDNQHYVMGSRNDNEMSEMQHYYSRLDYNGDLLFDTIYTFVEPFSYGANDWIYYTESGGNVIVNTTSFGAVDMGALPFIYSISGNGNVDWNYVYEANDYLGYDYTGRKVEKTNDGGYLLHGGNFDMAGQGKPGLLPPPPPVSKYGYIYKLDATGNVDWSKFYTNKDSIEYTFSTIKVLDNGEILTVGNAANYRQGGFKLTTPGMYDNFLNIGKLDETGALIWNSALLFDSIAQNSNGFNVNSIQVKGDEAFILFEYYNDLTFYNGSGVVSIDINTGAVNWIKGYSLESVGADVYPQTSLMLDDNLTIAYNSYGSWAGTGILKLDDTGNILDYTSFVESIGNSSFLYDIMPTQDGGAIAVGGLNAGEGTMIYKMDKSLKTYCPNEESPIVPLITDLTATIYNNIMDSIFDVTLTPTSLSVINTVNDSGFTNVDCKCELIVDGYAYDNIGVGMDSVLIKLFKYEPLPGEYVVYDTISTSSNGYYYFNSLPEGDYIVKAIPNLTANPEYINTYFGIPNEVYQWDSAAVINLMCGGNSIAYNIDVIQGFPQTGSWTCNGYVFEHYGYDPVNKKAPGEPLGDIDITIDQSPGGAISSTTTDEFGYYEFTGLNNNATFVVRADIPGLPNDSIYTFTVNPGDGALDSLNFYVDSVGVYILLEDLFTSVKNNIFSNIKYDVIPNPTRGLVSLVVESKEDVEVEIVITNVMGEFVFINSYKASSGVTKYPIDLTSYTQGLYFIRINQGNDYIIKKIIKQ